ncbi:hypothetical protein HQ531_11755, partial [bacterium]|nr:hypothetical protein [bacterium]
MMEEREYGIATFDESDVISRFQPTAKAGFYKWDDDAQWHSEFSNPRICEQYLAMIQTLYDRGIKTEDLNEVSGNVFLPDVDGDLHAFPDLYSSSFISHGFPTEELPPIIDRKLAPHPILKKKHWRLPNVTLSKFLDEHELNESSDTYRRRIWLWVNKESNNISTLDLRRLAGVKIWPDTRGNLFSLAELCHPRQKILRDAVAKHINIPSRAVLRLPKIKSAKRGILFIRSYPSEEEF